MPEAMRSFGYWQRKTLLTPRSKRCSMNGRLVVRSDFPERDGRRQTLSHPGSMKPGSNGSGIDRGTSHDSKIEAIFQTPLEEGSECDEELGGGSKEKAEAGARDKDDTRTTAENPNKSTEGGAQTKDAPVNGIIVAGGRKICKHCGNPVED